ncbi:butyrophilin subfamily 1 member A1-like [Leucoraja erinacea]|uniref:butyrophilin subfamily 1 member A1-like n=1 Tax=Leucoraja erinaceus TaxID=7782 RepID=UPI0024537B20|nr:butyrophilin subfamily 1 member A1-like [Leucoraja erinacea]
MNAVGFPSDVPGRLAPTGISTWSSQTWDVLTVAVIMVSVTTWVIARKRGCEGPGCEGRGSLALELLLQVMILAPTMLFCYWGSSCPEPLRAVGTDRPTVSVPGDSVVLPCRAVTHTQAGSLGLEWRNLRTGDVILACGEDGGECRGYREGAWLLDSGREARDLSLHLDTVRVTDAGRYKCTIFTGRHSSTALMELSVAALGTKPIIAVECVGDSTLLYSCRSGGWFPEPALVWKSSDGTSLLPRSNVSRTRGEAGLYGLEIQYWAHHDVPHSVICIARNTVTNVKMVSAARTSGEQQ